MIQVTSEIAYKKIIEDGTFSRQQGIIVRYLLSVGKPQSAREIQRGLQNTTGTWIGINAISGRVAALKDMGILVGCTKRKCTVTGSLITPVECKATVLMQQFKKPEYHFEPNGQGAFC